MRTQRIGSTGSKISTYVERLLPALAERVAVFCHIFLPTNQLYCKIACFSREFDHKSP